MNYYSFEWYKILSLFGSGEKLQLKRCLFRTFLLLYSMCVWNGRDGVLMSGTTPDEGQRSFQRLSRVRSVPPLQYLYDTGVSGVLNTFLNTFIEYVRTLDSKYLYFWC